MQAYADTHHSVVGHQGVFCHAKDTGCEMGAVTATLSQHLRQMRLNLHSFHSLYQQPGEG